MNTNLLSSPSFSSSPFDSTTVKPRAATEALFFLLSTSLGISVRKEKEKENTINGASLRRGRVQRKTNNNNEDDENDEAESGLRDNRAHITDNDLSWSQEAEILQRQLHHCQPNHLSSLSSLHYLFSFFKTLRLLEMKITYTDDLLARFSSLLELTLSGNLLSSITHLPSSLLILHAYANQIVSLPESLPPSLQLLGLGFNSISHLPSSSSPSSSGYSSLLSLDLSYNKLFSLHDTLSFLSSIPSLRHLALIGNPICLLPSYSLSIISSLPWISVLDDIPVSSSEKKTRKESSSLLGPISSPFSFSSLPPITLTQQSETFTLAFSVDYIESSHLSSFLMGESTPSNRPSSPSPLPVPPSEEELSCSFYVVEFEMPGTGVLNRSEPVYFSLKDNHKYDILFHFSTSSELFADLPTVLESEIYFYLLQCKLPGNYVQTQLTTNPQVIAPNKTDINNNQKRGTKAASAKKPASPVKKKHGNEPAIQSLNTNNGNPNNNSNVSNSNVNNNNESPLLVARQLSSGTNHFQHSVVEFLRNNPSNSPLVITPLGRAQMDLSSLLSGQNIVEQHCKLSFANMVLQRQHLIEQNKQIPEAEQFLKVKATLNST